MKTEGRDQAVNWIKGLDKKIRVYVDDPHEGGSGFWKELRRLTSREWEVVQEHINEYELPCYLYPTAYGFVFAIHTHGEIESEQPEQIIVIDDSAFPFRSASKGFAGQDETLEILEQFTHSSRNVELLKWYGFRPLSPVESYSY